MQLRVTAAPLSKRAYDTQLPDLGIQGPNQVIQGPNLGTKEQNLGTQGPDQGQKIGTYTLTIAPWTAVLQ